MVEKKEKQKSEWIEWLKAIAIALFIAFFLRTFIFATSIVEGESMSPTLEDGERLIFNKLIYIIDEPERGDIIIIQKPTKNYVKRVIGLPGETIEINDGILYINGEKFSQDFLSDEAKLQTNNFGPEIIPEDSYFVMGDNRAISKDSRNGLGLVTDNEIVGRSEIIIYPFSEWSRTK